MSEFEEESRRQSSASATMFVVGIVFVVGCLVVCAGLVGVGLMLPMRQRQAAEAAQQAQRNAVEQARAAQAAAAKAEKAPVREETAEPAAEPAKDSPQVESDETENAKTLE